MVLPEPARTWLFVPAHRRALVAKAIASRADVVILDLEDSVPAAEKAAARAGVTDALRAPRTRAVVVRVTADDLASDLAAALQPGASGVVIAKATPALVKEADAFTAEAATADVAMIPLIEDATSLDAVDHLVAASPRVRLVAFGSLDFASSLGLVGHQVEASLDHIRQHLVLASRRAGLSAPIDSPVFRLGEPGFVGRRARRSRSLGFQGMLLIHPEQIQPVRNAYRPSEREVKAARRIVKLYESAYRNGVGALKIDDLMIDAANVATYRRVIAEAEN